MIDIVIASNNKHKIKEIKKLVGGFFHNLFSLEEMNICVDVEETGATFYENALLKARAISEMTNMAALADDSGLEVEYLNGAPGIWSARFAGIHSDDKKNNALLLQKMEGVKNREACFVSTIVIYFPNGEIIFAEGKVNGKVLNVEKGNFGFGYDPLFYSYELEKSFGEATDEEKNKVSHRSRALGAIAKKLAQRK